MTLLSRDMVDTGPRKRGTCEIGEVGTSVLFLLLQCWSSTVGPWVREVGTQPNALIACAAVAIVAGLSATAANYRPGAGTRSEVDRRGPPDLASHR